MASCPTQKRIKDVLNDGQGDQYQVSSNYQGNENKGIARKISSGKPRPDESPYTHTGVKPDLISVSKWAKKNK